jgi:hypothetical protein
MPPTMLLDTLAAVRRRVRLMTAAFGVGVAAASAVALLLALILLDYTLNLPAVPRAVLAVSALIAVSFVVARWIARPLVRRLPLGEVAGRLEAAFPQFQDRLRSTVDILNGQVPGSNAMKQRIVAETASLAGAVDLNRAVVLRPVWYSTAAGTGAILLAALLMLAVGGRYTRVALDRLLLPFGEHPWPKTVQLDLVGTVPPRVAVGQRVDVNVRLVKGDRANRRALILYQYGDGADAPVEQEYMTRGDDGVYHASLDARIAAETAVVGTMKIWMQAGDDKLALPPVKVVQRLTTKSVEAVITPPAYAALPPVSVNLGMAPAMATLGSSVQLRATFSKPLADGVDAIRVEPIADDDATSPSGAAPAASAAAAAPPVPTLNWNRQNDGVIAATFAANASMRFHLRATDQDGLSNTAIEEYELIVRPDQNPAVQIDNPRQNENRTGVAVVPLSAVAEDDFGISSLKLVVDRLGDQKHWEIPLVQTARPLANVAWTKVEGSGDLQRFRADYGWDLSALDGADLKSGDVLEYYALVTDNFSLNGKTHAPVASGHLRLDIISQDELTTRLTEALRSVGEAVAAVKLDQDRTQRETAGLARQSADRPAMDDADKVAADRLANQQSTAAAQTKQLAMKLADLQQQLEENKSPAADLKETLHDVAQLLNSTAEDPMKNAAADISGAKNQPGKSQRNDALQQAQAEQGRADEGLQKALDRMGNVGSLARTIDQIKALLAQQQQVSAETAAVGRNNLGKTPDQMSDADRQRLGANARAQAALAQQTDKALAQLAKTADQLSKTDPTASSAMKEAADTAQQQNISPNQQKAADAASQNQQSQAQAAQKQAELGLQMMLNSLNEAQRRKLEELAKKLEDLQQQVGNLVRRQAGHNLDNLALQGGDRIGKLETADRRKLFDEAERDAKAPPPAIELPTLTDAQEQTEQNTRDIAKTAADLPNGNGPADQLTDAADKMERAIVSLRDAKLADAYNPPQAEALGALEGAKREIDKQKAAADQKRQEQQKEAIRQVYVELKAAQDKLNIDTAKIDSSPRLDDGSLRRIEAVRLGQLPGEQGALADRAAGLNDDLSALGSVVYIWANKDIVATMNEVKDDLGRPVTGAPTQAEQKRVSDQLDAMIRDLKVIPIESKFAQHSSGGGGGQCSPGLPSEPELRLMKDLQVAVNDSTRTIAAQKNADKPKLLSLGGRQGELRDLLDQLLQKSSGGQMKLGPEPDNRDQLPEEAKKEDVENQELDTSLLNDKPGAAVVQKDMNLVGDRMGRARQRLAINDDPGEVTQAIQEKIISNLDDLIEMARKKQAQSAGQPQPPNPQQAMAKPKPSSGIQPQNGQQQQANAGLKRGNNPASADYAGGGSQSADVSADIRQKMSEWGGVTPRQRQAVIEGAGEQVIEKYKTMVDDYYRSLATKSDRQQ